jgi:hypothetical protein
MSTLLTASILLLVFAFGYYLFLRQGPALSLRRRVLLLGIVGGLLLPLCPAPPVPQVVKGQVPVVQVVKAWEVETLNATSSFVSAADVPSANSTSQMAVSRVLSPKGILFLGYRLIVLVFLVRLVFGLTRLAFIHRSSQPTTAPDIRILKGRGEAFTFGRTVYLSAAVYDSADAEVIIAHERAHARQLHTLDALLVEVLRAVFWFHPMAWWLRGQVQLNLEYLADAAVLHAGYDRRAYQLSLVAHQHGTDFRTSLLPQFAAKGLKRRIKMMGFRAGPQVRSLVAVGGLIFVSFVAFACTAGEAENTLNEEALTEEHDPGIAPLFNGEATELNVYFKRLPTPAEVAKIRPYLRDYFQYGVAVYQRCADPVGSYHLHLGSNEKTLSGVISWSTNYYSDDAVRFHFTKNGIGNSGSSTFSPKLPPAGAPDADVFLNLNGKWTVIDEPGSEPYSKATLDPPAIQAQLECRLGTTPENKDDYSTWFSFGNVMGNEQIAEVVEELLTASEMDELPRTYYIGESTVGEQAFMAHKGGKLRMLYAAARSNGADNRVVLMLEE